MKIQSRLDVRKFSFSQRAINVWNKLPAACVQASSVNMFKNRIDKYMGCLKKTCNFWKNDCNRGVSQIFECVIIVLSIYV